MFGMFIVRSLPMRLAVVEGNFFIRVVWWFPAVVVIDRRWCRG